MAEGRSTNLFFYIVNQLYIQEIYLSLALFQYKSLFSGFIKKCIGF
jgi:hypothetical protein